jgi:hypothetical protein
MNSINECLRALEVPDDIEKEYLSRTEKERYEICTKIEGRNTITLDASVFDRETLRKVIKYLNEKGINYEVINT